MMLVDRDKCVGCTLCIKDCPVKDIELNSGKAFVKNEACINCGHCIAICPKNAVFTDEKTMDEVIEYKEDEFKVEPKNLLNFIKFRRSVRNFKPKDVEDEKIMKIIEAGRYTQTSTNSQDVSYVVVKDKINELKDLAMESLYEKGKYLIENLNEDTKPFERYARKWINMFEEYKKDNKKDGLFFNAPVVILVVSKTPINGGLASSNMELMIDSLGLGTFFSGFFQRAAVSNKKIMEFLDLEEDQNIVSCMVVGYPNVKYQRTVPRKEAKVTFK